MTRSRAEELLGEESKALFADGFDDAILGISTTYDWEPVVAYDYGKCVAVLMKRDGMSKTDAEEFMEFNVTGSFMGPSSPVFVETE